MSIALCPEGFWSRHEGLFLDGGLLGTLVSRSRRDDFKLIITHVHEQSHIHPEISVMKLEMIIFLNYMPLCKQEHCKTTS